MGREETQAVIAPVISQAHLHQAVVLHEVVNGHEFDGRDAQVLQILDDGGMGEAGVGAAQFFRHVRVLLGQSFDVGFVNHRCVHRDVGAADAFPVVGSINDYSLGDEGGRVVLIHDLETICGGFFDGVREHGGVPLDGAIDGLRVRIDEQFIGVEHLSLQRVPFAMGAETVAPACFQVRDEAVPDQIRLLHELNTVSFLFRGIFGEKAKIDPGGVFTEHGKIYACGAPGCPQWVGFTGPYFDVAKITVGLMFLLVTNGVSCCHKLV